MVLAHFEQRSVVEDDEGRDALFFGEVHAFFSQGFKEPRSGSGVFVAVGGAGDVSASLASACFGCLGVFS